MAIPLYGQNADGDNLQYSADGKTGSIITWGDADVTIEPGDLAGVKTSVYSTAAATASRTLYLPDAAKCSGKEIEIYLAVASDSEQNDIDSSAGGAFVGGVLSVATATASIVQSNGSNTILTVNDNIEPGSWVKVWSNGTNWYVTGTILCDAAPAFS